MLAAAHRAAENVISILRENDVRGRQDGVDTDLADLARPDDAGFEDMTEVAGGFVAPGPTTG